MRTFIIFYLLFSLLSKVSLCKENLIAEFLDNQIDIDVGFTGDKLTYFGALNKPLIYYNTNNYAWPLKTLFRHTYNRLRIFFKYQDITSINSLIADVLHPYFLKILSFFYFV